jgi:hypothetical protein
LPFLHDLVNSRPFDLDRLLGVNGDIPPPRAKTVVTEMEESPVNIVMLQDSVGARHISPSDFGMTVTPFYESVRDQACKNR